MAKKMATKKTSPTEEFRVDMGASSETVVHRDEFWATQPVSTPRRDSNPAFNVGPLRASVAELEGQLFDVRADLKAEKERCAALEAELATAQKKPELRYEPMPEEFVGLTKKFKLQELKLYLHLGFYADGRLGDIVVKAAKMGSFEAGMLAAFSEAVSLGLQHGIPLRMFVRRLRRMRFEPNGFTGDKEFPNVSSILDYIARCLEAKFAIKDEEEKQNEEG